MSTKLLSILTILLTIIALKGFNLNFKSYTLYKSDKDSFKNSFSPALNNKTIKISSSLSTKLDMTNNNNNNNISNRVNKILVGSSASIVVGLLGLMILLINRFLGVDNVISDTLSRSDIISLMACSAVLLNLLSETNITARERDSIPLAGEFIKMPIILDTLNKKEETSLNWLIKVLLTFSPSSSVHILRGEEFIGIGGVVAKGPSGKIVPKNKGKILDKAINDQEEVYLPDLQVFYNFYYNCYFL